MTYQGKIEEILSNTCMTAPVTVVDGCACPDDKPWYYCTCETQSYRYDCLCHNYEDVLSGDSIPSDTPTVDSVAQLIKNHPKAKFLYMGCKNYWSPKYGQGDHFSLAQKAAKEI